MALGFDPYNREEEVSDDDFLGEMFSEQQATPSSSTPSGWPPPDADLGTGIASVTDRPFEIPSLGGVAPTRPLDAPTRREPSAAVSTAAVNTAAPASVERSTSATYDDGGSADSGASYTPVRPRSPQSTPGAFTSMPTSGSEPLPTPNAFEPMASMPGASPAAMSVSLRAPYISNPEQYNPTGGGSPRLRNVAGGLIRGGQGVMGTGGPANEGVLSKLLQMILRNQG